MRIAADSEGVPHDWRLVPAAVVVWLAGITGLLGPWWCAAVCGVCGVVVAATMCLRSGVRAGGGTAVALFVAAALVCGPFLVRVHDAERDPLREYAARGADAVLRVSVTDRARPVRSSHWSGAPGMGTVLIRASVLDARLDGAAVPSTGRVLLMASAPGWADVLPGQQLTAAGSLAPARGRDLIVAVLTVGRADDGPTEVTDASWWQRAAHTMRQRLHASAGVLAPAEAGLLPALVAGDLSALPRQVEQDFRDSGMAHLVAVSGLHVGIVCGAVLLALRICRIGPRTSVLLAGAVLIGYVVLVGYRPSVLRAAAMGAIGLLALFVGRNRSALPALASAVAGLVLYDPGLAVSPGFAMSVVATAALVLLVPRWVAAMRDRGVPAGVAQAVAVPVAAFGATAPIIAGMSGQVSLVTVVANVLATPVVALTIVLGVLALVIAPLHGGLAEFVVRLAGPELGWLTFVARRTAQLPAAVLDWPVGWRGGVLAAVVVAVVFGVVLIVVRVRRLRGVLAACLAGAALILFPVRAVQTSWPPDQWVMVACDVGQGDSIAVATGEPGRAVVMDTGTDVGGADRCLDRLGVRSIPLLVLSHLHADHIGGLDAVLRGRAVGGIAVGPGRDPAWAWELVSETAARHDVPLVGMSTGQQLRWPGLVVDVIGPRHVPAEVGPNPGGTEINNASLVLRARTPAGSVLLTGDVELAAQADLLASGEDLRADVLKVPHHGSRYTLPEFLGAVGAGAAVISVGAGNTYGHPNQGTVDTLRGIGALVVRTDEGGDTAVVVADDGPRILWRGPG